jgi:hypothetical protein
MPTLFRNAGVIDDPASRGAMALHCIEYMGSRNSEYRCVIPFGIRDKMMHRLVLRANVARIYHCRHRLNTLSLARQQQPGKIGFERLTSVSMLDSSRNLVDIILKSNFSGIDFGGHAPRISQPLENVYHFMTQ